MAMNRIKNRILTGRDFAFSNNVSLKCHAEKYQGNITQVSSDSDGEDFNSNVPV